MAALMGAMTCLGECHDMPRWVPCIALVSGMAYLGGCHGGCQNKSCRTNFFFPVPFAQNVFVISLYDIWKVSQASNPRFALVPRWVPWHALVGAKTSHARTNSFLPVPFAQNVFLISLYDIWKVLQASNSRFASVPRWVPWHALVGAMVGVKTSHARENFFFARAICPKCVSNFII